MDGDTMMRGALKVITGCDTDPSTPLKTAVERRATVLIPSWTKRVGDYLYNGNRTMPRNLGWRFAQRFAMRKLDQPTPKEVLQGKFDDDLEATWHEAASSEHYYAYEKDWG